MNKTENFEDVEKWLKTKIETMHPQTVTYYDRTGLGSVITKSVDPVSVLLNVEKMNNLSINDVKYLVLTILREALNE